MPLDCPECQDTAADPAAIRVLMRPRLLARAAGRVARQYARARDLPGALPGQTGLGPGEIRARLAAAEAGWERARRTGAPGYRPARHVQVLGALLAETAETPGGAQVKASGSAAFRLVM